MFFISHITLSRRSATSYISMSLFSSDRLVGHALDHLVARIADGVNGVAETDDDFLVGHALANIGLGFVGRP